jgi:molybdopterin synthase sulfur carrier subunit
MINMAVIMVPSSLRRYTDQQSRVTLSASTVEEALECFAGNSSELRNHLFAGRALRNFVVVCKNGQDVRLLDGLATPLGGTDELQIVASVAGG